MPASVLSDSPIESTGAQREEPIDVLIPLTIGVLVLMAAVSVICLISAGEIHSIYLFCQHICCSCCKSDPGEKPVEIALRTGYQDSDDEFAFEHENDSTA